MPSARRRTVATALLRRSARQRIHQPAGFLFLRHRAFAQDLGEDAARPFGIAHVHVGPRQIELGADFAHRGRLEIRQRHVIGHQCSILLELLGIRVRASRPLRPRGPDIQIEPVRWLALKLSRLLRSRSSSLECIAESAVEVVPVSELRLDLRDYRRRAKALADGAMAPKSVSVNIQVPVALGRARPATAALCVTSLACASTGFAAGG